MIMDSTPKCPQCGRRPRPDAPAGLCLNCLARLGVAGPLPLPVANPPTPLPPASATLRYFGDYELLKELGRGGMGIVYLARQVSLDRLVAVKLLTQEHLIKPEFRRRFQQESRLAARLKHPNIVAIHEAGEHEGQPFFSMEYVTGTDLAKQIAGGKPLPERLAAGYLKTVAEALHYAHEQGVIHRDLKPSNILIGPDDQPRITDFGLARLMEPGTGLTQAGERLGTPEYMAPEQAFAGLGNSGVHSDVYGLGAVLYFLLTGRPPLAADSLGDLLHAVRDQVPVPPSRLNPAVPSALDSLCLWCLAKRPSRRPVSAQAVATELAVWLATPPDRSHLLAVGQRVRLWRRLLPSIATRIIAGLLIATGVMLALWFVWPEAGAEKSLQQLPPAEAQDPGTRYGLELSPIRRDAILALRATAAQFQATNQLHNWVTNWNWDYLDTGGPAKTSLWPGHPDAMMLGRRQDWPNSLHQAVRVPSTGVPVLQFVAKARSDCYMAVLVNGNRVWQAQLDTTLTNVLLDLRAWAGQRARLEIAHTAGGSRCPWNYEEIFLDRAGVTSFVKAPPGLVAPQRVSDTQTNGWWRSWSITGDQYALEDGGLPRIAPLLDGRPYVLLTHPLAPAAPCLLEQTQLIPLQSPLLRIVVRADRDFLLRVWVDDSLLASNVISMTGWTTLNLDLSPWAGTERRLRIEHAGGGPDAAWTFEGALWADLCITSAPALGQRGGDSVERR